MRYAGVRGGGPGDRNTRVGGGGRGGRALPARLSPPAGLARAQLHSSREGIHHQLPGPPRHQVPLHALLLERHVCRSTNVEPNDYNRFAYFVYYVSFN